MRGRATRLLALDTYFLLDNDDDEGDGEDHSGVSDDEGDGEDHSGVSDDGVDGEDHSGVSDDGVEGRTIVE